MINENDALRNAVLKTFGTPKVGSASHPALEEPVAEAKKEEKKVDPNVKLKTFGELIEESLNKASKETNEEAESKDKKRKEIIAESRIDLTTEMLKKLMR